MAVFWVQQWCALPLPVIYEEPRMADALYHHGRPGFPRTSAPTNMTGRILQEEVQSPTGTFVLRIADCLAVSD